MSKRVPNPLTRSIFSGRRPAAAGDLSVETQGIAPIPEDQRYGTPGRLFTVWFAPQVNMTGVFTGTLAIVLGLGFWLGLLAMVIGSVLGALIVSYLSTWGPRTGTGQLPNSRMAFGGGVVVPATLQWLSSIAWDALVGLFGGEALAVLLGIPFWTGVLIVLGVQGVVGFFGYELIHRMQAVLTVVLFTTFVVFAVKLVGGHDVITPASVVGADLVGAFVLEVTIAFSIAVSWASYAADFSRYLPADSSGARVFGFTFAGTLTGYISVEGIGIAAGDVLAEHTAHGVRSVMGGGAARWAGPSRDRGRGDRLGRDDRIQRIAGPADHRGQGAPAGVCRHRHGPGVRGDPVDSLRRQNDTFSGRSAAGGLLDPRVCRRCRHRLGAPRPRPRDHQPSRRTHWPRRRRCRGDRVRARLRRGDSVHEHDVDRGPDCQGVAWRRRRVFREPSGGRGALRRLPAAAQAPQCGRNQSMGG